MLFALTGGIQTGKTRWLSGLVEGLLADGVRCAGVLAPGVWRRRDAFAELPAGERSAGGRVGSAYEKLGIDNVLLPGGDRVGFARRADLARESGLACRDSQSSRAGLGWAIDDDAIARVNAHFEMLAAAADDASSPKDGSACVWRQDVHRGQAPSLLIVDELGRLELLCGEGLAAAVALLDRGPMPAYPHALVVVREDLLPIARERFQPAWGGIAPLRPDAEGIDLVRGLLFE